MSDTRERARELDKAWNDWADKQYFTMAVSDSAEEIAKKFASAFASSEAALARKQERLECAKAMCYECRKGDVPERRMYSQPPSPFWIHTMLGFDDRNEDCGASAIHERDLAETGGTT